MYAFAFAGAFRKIITKMGKRLASQFPNLGIIFGPRRPQTKGQGPQEEEEEDEEEEKEEEEEGGCQLDDKTLHTAANLGSKRASYVVQPTNRPKKVLYHIKICNLMDENELYMYNKF